MKIKSLTAALLCIGFAYSANAERTITSFSELCITKGESATIGGESYSQPGIYYLPDGDGFEAVRLTVAPAGPEDVTTPYLFAVQPNSAIIGVKSAALGNAVVNYGTSPENLDKSINATRTQIARNKYYWHTAELTDLLPATDYYYQVTCNGIVSDINRFRTTPDVHKASTVRVLMIGDHQRNEHSDYEWLIAAAKQKADEKWGIKPIEEHFNFIMNVGDQVDAATIDQYEQVMLYKASTISASLPSMTAVGNHEYKDTPVTTNRSVIQLYRNHFKNAYGAIEYHGIKSEVAEYYAYQVGNVLFVVLNSDDETPATQEAWARSVADKAKDDDTVKFIVAVQHRPLYAEMYCYDISTWARDKIMPMLDETGKLVLDYSGHHHLYARGQMTDMPLYHIISGGGVGTDIDGWEQLWGVGLATTDNLNQPEVQKTLDQWTYQIAEFDGESLTMTVETYSIGNRRLAFDNRLVDRFSRSFADTSCPETPTLDLSNGAEIDGSATITLKQTLTADAIEGLNTVQYQIATNPDFTDIEMESLVNVEDMYGVDDRFLPLDLNRSRDITVLTIPSNSLTEGKKYIRVRNRNANLQWSDYSSPIGVTISGSDGRPSISFDEQFVTIGHTMAISYIGAPTDTKRNWIGIFPADVNPGVANNLGWAYIPDGVKSGKVSITLHDNDIKNYTGPIYVTMLVNDGYTECSDRYFLTLGTSGVETSVQEEVSGQIGVFNLQGIKIAEIESIETGENNINLAVPAGIYIIRHAGHAPEKRLIK